MGVGGVKAASMGNKNRIQNFSWRAWREGTTRET